MCSECPRVGLNTYGIEDGNGSRTRLPSPSSKDRDSFAALASRFTAPTDDSGPARHVSASAAPSTGTNDLPPLLRKARRFFRNNRILEFEGSNSLSFSLSINLSNSSSMVAVDIAGAGEARIPKEARRILHTLASEWCDEADSVRLEVVQLKGSMTNEVYQINWPAAAAGRSGAPVGRKVLVRIYGEGVEVFFDREDEIRTFECMSRHGQGPRLLGRFPKGRVEEFIHARTLSAADLRDPEISALIALKLREFHDLDMPAPRKVFLWDRLRSWLKAALSLCSSEEAKEFLLDAIEEEITALEKLFSGDDRRIGFCHNDLQYGNIMIEEESRQLTIIDYEYASFNPIAYDIANHFCEMTADYHTETPHILDFNKYPDFDERKRFVQTYLSYSGENPDDLEVENLLQYIEKYTLASHLIWGLWGIISERVNEIDFDYMEYARQRFQQYWLRKYAILGS